MGLFESRSWEDFREIDWHGVTDCVCTRICHSCPAVEGPAHANSPLARRDTRCPASICQKVEWRKVVSWTTWKDGNGRWGRGGGRAGEKQMGNRGQAEGCSWRSGNQSGSQQPAASSDNERISTLKEVPVREPPGKYGRSRKKAVQEISPGTGTRTRPVARLDSKYQRCSAESGELC